jgi:regulator of replication initiation timing
LQEKDDEINTLKGHLGQLNAEIEQLVGENNQLKEGLEGLKGSSEERERIDIL